MSGALSGRQAIGHAGMAGAVGEAGNRLVAAKDEIRAAAIADWIGDGPSAFSSSEVEQ
jgi:hypothetical protein